MERPRAAARRGRDSFLAAGGAEVSRSNAPRPRNGSAVQSRPSVAQQSEGSPVSGRAHKYTESPVLRLSMPVWRSRFLLVLLTGALALLIVRAFQLQVMEAEFLNREGESRHLREMSVAAMRGRVFDRDGEVLAVSTPVRSIWAIPADVKAGPAELQQLAALLALPLADLQRKLAGDRRFVFLARQIAPETAERIAGLKLAGIYQDREYRRFYPAAELAAHLVGFTGMDGRGLEGIELALDGELNGVDGMRTVIRNRRGEIVEDAGLRRPARDGRDLSLALDSKIQYLAHSHLRDAVAQHRAKAGSVVVLDAKSGEVLALANWPTYNPNNRKNLAGAALRNRAVTDSFEPGSTLKPFTVALALEKGTVRFDTPIDTSPGSLTIGRARISDTRRHGVLTVAQVLQKSSNVGTALMAAELPARDLWALYDGLGFGKVPALGFPGEVSGRLRPWSGWRPIEKATMSYGHGLSMSLIQLARAYTVFATEGKLLPLSLTRLDRPLPAGMPVLEPQTAREVLAMLEMATHEGGTAPRARVPGYRVAGKTGTANKIEDGAYASRYVASFVGLAPVSDPRLIVAVMVDEPSAGVYYGGEVAAPVFSAVMAGALRRLDVAPDDTRLRAGLQPAPPVVPFEAPAADTVAGLPLARAGEPVERPL
jgi:cell division protein FtsI (penicillin-binding protein 3)